MATYELSLGQFWHFLSLLGVQILSYCKYSGRTDASAITFYNSLLKYDA